MGAYSKILLCPYTEYMPLYCCSKVLMGLPAACTIRSLHWDLGACPWATHWMSNVWPKGGLPDSDPVPALQLFTISGTGKGQRRILFRLGISFIGHHILPSRQSLIQLTHSLNTSVFILLWWKRFQVSWNSLFCAWHTTGGHSFHLPGWFPDLAACLSLLRKS